jgi:serine/threonine-protein kinase HipA
VGRLRAHTRKNKESATFQYDESWLANPAKFSLEPALQVGPGPFHTLADTALFGAIGDSAPDRWGRTLMRRMHAAAEGGKARTLQEIDYLLLVDDEARQGALRFAEKEDGPFLRPEGVKRIPPLVELPKLLAAAEKFMDEKDTGEDLRLLFAPGSSLGGARPKASVRERTEPWQSPSFRARTTRTTRCSGKGSRSRSHKRPVFPYPNPASKSSRRSRFFCCGVSTATANAAFPFSPP